MDAQLKRARGLSSRGLALKSFGLNEIISRKDDMNVLDAIKTRRSIRKYKPDPIPAKDLKMILEAAQLAPSAGNRQPWEFIIVRDSETKKKLAVNSRKQLWVGEAGVVIAALAMDKKDPRIYERWAEKDVMTAIEHMVLSAWELGYGTCWIGAFDQKEVKKILDVPEEMTIISLLPIGVPDEKPRPKVRKPFEETFFSEKYGKTLYI